MHEVDMTKCLLIALHEWRDQQDSFLPVVDAIHLEVGRFTCVEPEQLLFTFQAAVAGSWLEGAALHIDEIPFVGRCLCCSTTYNPVPELAYRSPCCDHPLEEIVSGRELRIRSIDYRHATDSPAQSQQLCQLRT